MKDRDGHGGDKNREVEPERADQKKHEQDRFQVGPLPDVAEAFRKAPRGSDGPGVPMKFADAQQTQRAEHGHERKRVDQEDPPGAHGGDEHTGDGRPDQARGVERGGIQRHRVREVVFPDQLRDESLARGRIERRGAAQPERKRVHVPQPDQPGDREDAQAEGEQPHRRLRGEQELAPVEMIGRRTGPGQQEKLRAELERHDHRPRPSRSGGSVAVSTSQSWAVRCIHVPTLDTSAPPAQSR